MLLEKDNVKMPTASEIIEYLNRTNRITNIQVEEKAIPLGSWSGKLGEIVSIKL